MSEERTKLRKLAANMQTFGSRTSSMKAGTTYFGQFISHDFVPPTKRKRGGRLVTPFLNLDSVYGQSVPKGKFITRQVKDTHLNRSIVNYDLERFPCNGVARIPEHRNDENVIVAQIHALFQRLHNKIFDDFTGDHELAKTLVIKTFQLVVIEEFLRDILDEQVYGASIEQGEQFLSDREPAHIPPFFSHAAFRFGHSIVRSSYTLRSGEQEVDLVDMFRATQPLTPEFAVDWPLFFGDAPQFALKIDFGVTPPMRQVSFPLDSPDEKLDVILLNLLAGQAADLPSGAEMVNAVKDKNHGNAKFRSLGLEPLDGYPAPLAYLNDYFTIGSLPLWPYLLIEAQAHNKGNHLGPLGSVLVADVFYQAIKGSQTTVLSQQDYNFEQALQSMGSWGQTLQAAARDNHSAARITMNNLITLVG